MLTRNQLAELLRRANVEDVSRLSGVSTKTIYRIRQGAWSPNFGTVEKLIPALDKLGVRLVERAV